MDRDSIAVAPEAVKRNVGLVVGLTFFASMSIESRRFDSCYLTKHRYYYT